MQYKVQKTSEKYINITLKAKTVKTKLVELTETKVNEEHYVTVTLGAGQSKMNSKNKMN